MNILKRLTLALALAVTLTAATPSYENVPDNWKQPFGPYVQAPAEFGAKWYRVSPFDPTPWVRDAPAGRTLPDGFVDIFGSEPQASEFHTASNPSLAYRVAKVQWEQDLATFLKVGAPDFLTPEIQSQVERIFSVWQMGKPRYYANRYGYQVRFPDSAVRNFQTSAYLVANNPHIVVAQYQVEYVNTFGKEPPGGLHPFLFRDALGLPPSEGK